MNETGGLGDFSKGFSGGGQAADPSTALIVLLVLAGFVALVWFLQQRSKAPPKSSTRSRPAARTFSRPAPRELYRPRTASAPVPLPFVPKPNRINPLQQTIIHDLIDEFRQHEPSAQAVPTAVLEKYSEFFFHQIKKLKTSDAEVREYVNQHYPLKAGYAVELDFHASGVLHLVKSKIFEVSAKTITVDFQEPIPAFVKHGASVLLNYSVGKHFLQGSTTVVDVRRHIGVVLKKPNNIALLSERRYARVGLRSASGILQNMKTEVQSLVQVLDLSFEGVRVQVQRPLDRGHLYLLTFDAQANGQSWSFGPLECLPSKAFLTGAGTYEAGLLFLYLDSQTKQKLQDFMKNLNQELLAKKAAQAAAAQ